MHRIAVCCLFHSIKNVLPVFLNEIVFLLICIFVTSSLVNVRESLLVIFVGRSLLTLESITLIIAPGKKNQEEKVRYFLNYHFRDDLLTTL